MKKLVIYFSHTGENYAVGIIDKGNTEVIADYIVELTGADKFEIKPEKEYSKKYSECCNEAKEMLNNKNNALVKEYLDSIDNYDTIYIGYPIWWGTCPAEVLTFIKHYNFDGKIVKPFSTHEGSNLGTSINDIKLLMPNATVLEGIAIKGSTVKYAKKKIESWIN